MKCLKVHRKRQIPVRALVLHLYLAEVRHHPDPPTPPPPSSHVFSTYRHFFDWTRFTLHVVCENYKTLVLGLGVREVDEVMYDKMCLLVFVCVCVGGWGVGEWGWGLLLSIISEVIL